jgi:membrane-bound lytic murein transglycosylase D
LAAEVIAAADAAIQADLLIRDYVAELRQVMAALGGAKELRAGGHGPRQVEGHSALSFIESILKANSLPPQLTAVIMVESAGDPMALSPKGARGLWQLMPDTARRYGLRVDSQVDERVDAIRSTYAAVRYLADLYQMFNDWPLALAAYNTGENRIQRVMDRTGIRRFSEMADRQLLSAETIKYVPAVLNLMRRTRNTNSVYE